MSRPRLAVLAAVLLASCAGPTLVMARASPAAPAIAVEPGAVAVTRAGWSAGW